MTDMLVNMILEKDPAAIDLARRLGNPAGEAIKPLFKNEDSTIRQIAIYSAYETGMSDLSGALVPLLTDESPSVRTAVLIVLKKRLDSNIYPSLLQIFPKVPDAADRQELALITADIPGARAADLIKLRDEESNATARTGCVVALAKLGDTQSQYQFLDSLDKAKGQNLKLYLEYAEYIAQPWLLPGLSGLLDNKGPLVFIGSHHAPGPGPDHLRACDIVVDLIAKITNARFSFTTNRAANYTDAQIEEVRRLI